MVCHTVLPRTLQWRHKVVLAVRHFTGSIRMYTGPGWCRESNSFCLSLRVVVALVSFPGFFASRIPAAGGICTGFRVVNTGWYRQQTPLYR